MESMPEISQHSCQARPLISTVCMTGREPGCCGFQLLINWLYNLCFKSQTGPDSGISRVSACRDCVTSSMVCRLIQLCFDPAAEDEDHQSRASIASIAHVEGSGRIPH